MRTKIGRSRIQASVVGAGNRACPGPTHPLAVAGSYGGLPLPILLVTFAATIAMAQEPNLAGHWAGVLKTAGAEIRLVLNIEQTPAGTWRATLDSPDQGALGIPVSRLTLAGRHVSAAIDSLRLSYEADLNDDGESLGGTFKQGEQGYPLTLTRTATPPTVARPQTPRPPFPYQEQPVSFTSAPGVTLAGTVTVPDGNGPFGAVVLVSGSGPQDRNETLFGHQFFWVLADHLARHGIACLRYDDRGVADSTGDFAAATTRDFAQDAAAAVKFAQAHDAIDPRLVVVAGHSEGGLIAPMVAVENRDLAGIVLLAGPGVDGAAISRLQTALLLDEMQVNVDGRQHILAARDKVIERLRAGGSEAIMKESLKPLIGDWITAEGGEATPVGINSRLDELTSPWMRFFLSYDPAPTLQQVICPVLALNGSLDTQVDAAQNLPAIVAALEAGHNQDYAVFKLARLNHLFQTATTGTMAEYGRIQETCSLRLLNTLSAWLTQRLKRQDKGQP